jgi:beta-mannosidase
MFTRYFRVPEGFESFVYLSQVQQAMAIRTAVEHWRSLRPRCMGTLYWQLNDVWPVCSWSSVEHSGAWKLLHYAAARFFAPVLLAGRVHDGGVEIRLTNDLLESVTARVTMSVFEFSGRLAGTESWRARVPAGSSRLVARRPLSKIAPDPDKVFVSLSLERGTAAAESELFLVKPKRCTLAQARVRAAISGTDKAPVVDLSTDAPAFFVSLHADGIAGEFEDNCFTLLPGAPRALGFRPRQRVSLERFRRAFSLRHLRDTYR